MIFPMQTLEHTFLHHPVLQMYESEVKVCSFSSDASLAGTQDYWLMSCTYEDTQKVLFQQMARNSVFEMIFAEEGHTNEAQFEFRPLLLSVMRWISNVTSLLTHVPIRIITGTASKGTLISLARSILCDNPPVSLLGFDVMQYDNRGSFEYCFYEDLKSAQKNLTECIRKFFELRPDDTVLYI